MSPYLASLQHPLWRVKSSVTGRKTCFWVHRASEFVPGATACALVCRCELIYFDTKFQPVNTLVLVCPGKDMIRLWPWPVQRIPGAFT